MNSETIQPRVQEPSQQHLPHRGRTFLPDWQARTCKPCSLCNGTGLAEGEFAPRCEGCGGDGCNPVCGCLAYWPVGSFDLQDEGTWERGNCNWQWCPCGCHSKAGSHQACCQGECIRFKAVGNLEVHDA